MKHFKKLLCFLVFITILVVSWRFRKLGNEYGSRHKTVKSKDDEKKYGNSSNDAQVSKRKILLVIGIISAPARLDRRQAIRQTWMHAYKDNPSIVYRFFTDSISNVNHKWKGKLKEEQSKHKDMEFMAVPRGLNFGLRMLWLIDWTISNYNFEFLLRLDDDYLVCLERLVGELEARKAQRLYWGYFHCSEEGQVRADEAFLILSQDVIKSILEQRDNLFCNPFGDQSVAMWMKRIDHVTYFHDTRLLHEGMQPDQQYVSHHLCQSYIGVHHVYPDNALDIWKKNKLQRQLMYDVPHIPPLDKVCKYSKIFDWRSMEEGYRFKPDRCNNKPVWKDMKMWGGKNGDIEVPWQKRRIIVNK